MSFAINVVYMDDTVEGKWYAKIKNFDGILYKIPHEKVKDTENITHLNYPCVYFLFGTDEKNKPFIYVGQTETPKERLLQSRTFEKDGYVWEEAVVYVKKDVNEALNAADIRYLEKRFYEIALNAKRYEVKNRNEPSGSKINSTEKNTLEEVIEKIKKIMPVLGHKVFEKVKKSEIIKNTDIEPIQNETNVILRDEKTLYFLKPNIKAYCRIDENGFTVIKGSYISEREESYIVEHVKEKRKEKGLIDKNRILLKDVSFKSISAAASFVSGTSLNGKEWWGNKNGVIYKELIGANDLKRNYIETPKIVKTENDKTRKVYLSENYEFKNKKLQSFIFMGQKTNVKSFTDMLKSFMDSCYLLDGKTMEKLANQNYRIENARSIYMSEYKSDLRSYGEIKNTGIYFETNLSADNVVKFIKSILKEMNLSLDDFIVNVKK